MNTSVFLMRDGHVEDQPDSTASVRTGKSLNFDIAFGPPEVSNYQGTTGILVRWPFNTAEARAKELGGLAIMQRDAGGRVTEIDRSLANLAGDINYAILLNPDFLHEPVALWVVPFNTVGYPGRPSRELAYDTQPYPDHAERERRRAAGTVNER